METVKEKIDNLYNNLYDKINTIHQIFIDYYGEDRVDLQDILDKKEFNKIIDNFHIKNYLYKPYDFSASKWDSLSSSTLESLDSADANIIINSFSEIYNRNVLKSPFILVWWPSVRITNEYDRYVDITHLYAKIYIDLGGLMSGRFTLNRAEYPISHLRSNYLHSHVCSIPVNDFTVFQSCCTGTGPINGTMSSLTFNFDIDLWGLFCLELDKYVHVESIAGTPYHRLEDIGASTHRGINWDFFAVSESFPWLLERHNCPITKIKFNEFIKYFLNKRVLKFNYSNNVFSLGISFIDCSILVSNCFIEWYNELFNNKQVTATFESLTSYGVLRQCIITNGKIYNNSGTEITNNAFWEAKKGQLICLFKGKEIKLNILDTAEDTSRNEVVLLDNCLISCIITRVLKIINYNYGRKENNQSCSEIYYV